MHAPRPSKRCAILAVRLGVLFRIGVEGGAGPWDLGGGCGGEDLRVRFGGGLAEVVLEEALGVHGVDGLARVVHDLVVHIAATVSTGDIVMRHLDYIPLMEGPEEARGLEIEGLRVLLVLASDNDLLLRQHQLFGQLGSGHGRSLPPPPLLGRGGFGLEALLHLGPELCAVQTLQVEEVLALLLQGEKELVLLQRGYMFRIDSLELFSKLNL